MFNRLFVDHPHSVGESYVEHMRFAGRFGLRMIGGGIAALVHALVPGWCVTTASHTLRALNRDVIEQRRARQETPPALAEMLDWVI